MPVRVYLSAPNGHLLPTRLLESAVRATLDSEGVGDGELSLTFLPDPPIQAMNERWLGHDWVPDVLSFALHEPGDDPVGDIYVGIEQAARQAEEHGVSVDEELVRLAVHGTLHVLGYDHAEGDGGGLVEKQEAIVGRVIRASEPGVTGGVGVGGRRAPVNGVDAPPDAGGGER